MIEYDCPNCGRRFMSPDSRKGQRRKCGGCNAQFRIAAASRSESKLFGTLFGELARQLRRSAYVWQGPPGVLAIVVVVVFMLSYGLSNTTPEARNFTGSVPAEAAARTEIAMSESGGGVDNDTAVAEDSSSVDAEPANAAWDPFDLATLLEVPLPTFEFVDESVAAVEPHQLPEIEAGAVEEESPAALVSAVEEVSVTEVEALRETVARMQQTLDIFTETIATDLREENERLRESLSLARNDSGESMYLLGNGELMVPADDRGELLEAPIAAPEPEPAAMTIVREWGRSPELAARLPGDFSSLKGMIVAVPYGRSDEELTKIAKDLRTEYALYDNVNIEVFENMAAAEAYSETGTSPNPEARVLSLSKFANTGRSVNLLLRGESVTVIP